VVHGTIWLGGRDPARVSASTWANRPGHGLACGSSIPPCSGAPDPDCGPGTARGGGLVLTIGRPDRMKSSPAAGTLASRRRVAGRVAAASSYGGAISGTAKLQIAWASGSGLHPERDRPERGRPERDGAVRRGTEREGRESRWTELGWVAGRPDRERGMSGTGSA
jgi:hypothetical protein